MTLSFKRKTLSLCTRSVYTVAITLKDYDDTCKHRFLNHKLYNYVWEAEILLRLYVWRILFIKFKASHPPPPWCCLMKNLVP